MIVVAVEDGAALVAGQEHGNPLGGAGADQVAGGGAAAIVKEAGRHAGRLTGGAPRRAPAADGDAVAVEDQRAVGVAARPSPRQGLGNRLRNGEHPPHQRLRARGREPDDATGFVDLVPGGAEDLVPAPAGVVGKVEDVLPRGGQVGADGEVFGVLEEALRFMQQRPLQPARHLLVEVLVVRARPPVEEAVTDVADRPPHLALRLRPMYCWSNLERYRTFALYCYGPAP